MVVSRTVNIRHFNLLIFYLNLRASSRLWCMVDLKFSLSIVLLFLAAFESAMFQLLEEASEKNKILSQE